jgi:(1->4)-alpha-D-glucan 1-alpha-D-glucosylmutase
VKALRETKRPSDWALPNESYENTCRAYLDRIMEPGSVFIHEAAAFVASIGPAAAINGLTQEALHLTVPGVPDLYQGTEWWDFSMVDPDNRRPVDYVAREAALGRIGDTLDARTLLQQWTAGHIKQAVVTKLLRLRAAKPALFARGDYTPLPVEGAQSAHVLAFMRRDGSDRVLVAVPLHAAELVGDARVPQVEPARWGDTSIVLPPGTASNAWTDVMTGQRRRSASRRLQVAELFADLPVAVLHDASRG